VSADLGKSGPPIGGLGDNRYIFLGLNQHGDAGSDQRLVIDYDYSDHPDTSLHAAR
jgi:hypothetical protein